MVDKFPPHHNLKPGSPLVAAAVGTLFLAGSCGLYLFYPSATRLVQWGVSLGVILLLLAILLQPDAIHQLLTGQSIKYASNAVVTSLAFIGILILANYLGAKNNVEYDLTETGQFTLSEQTIEVLNNLTEPVQVMAFFRATDYRWKAAKEYLERYSQHTNMLTYSLHDPSANPTLAQNYNIDHYGLVFINGIYRYHAPRVDEKHLTTGVMYVTSYKHNKKVDKLVSIQPKKRVNRHLYLTPAQTGLALFTTVVMLPLAFVAAGLRAWWLRR